MSANNVAFANAPSLAVGISATTLPIASNFVLLANTTANLIYFETGPTNAITSTNAKGFVNGQSTQLYRIDYTDKFIIASAAGLVCQQTEGQ